MATPSPALRRRAACAVLAPLLDEDALMLALQLQHAHLRSEGVADLIAYIDAVATLNHFDQATRKRLYQAFYEALRLPDAALPLDPWPAMQAGAAPAPTAPTAARPPTPEVLPPEPASKATEAQPPASTTATLPPPVAAAMAPAPSPAQQVFAALMQAALADLRQLHGHALDEVRQAALAMLPKQRMNAPLRQQLQEAWQLGQAGPWHVDATESGLSDAVNLFYVALCEALGPVDADHILTRAVRNAEQTSAAREFSPRRLV